MELRHLRYFLAVAEEQHFGRAASRLHVTQSTLSAQVQGLEREVGGPLFVRTSRRVELTEAGALLLVEARRALVQADRALDVARQSVSGQIGTLRIGFSGVAVLEGVLTQDVREFHRAHPQVKVELVELPPASQVQGVREGTIDVGYCPHLHPDDAPDLTMARRAQTSLSVAVRTEHPLATATAITVTDLADESLILYAADENDAYTPLRHTSASGVGRGRIRLVSSTLAALALAVAGAGAAVVPAVTERINLPEITYRPLSGPAAHLDVMLISRPDELSGPVRAYTSRHLVPDS